MANAKRASMREGPLAALFRKTEGAEGEQGEGREPEQAAAPAAAEPRAASAPQTPAAAHPRESGLPHPALGAAAQAPAEPAPRGQPAGAPAPRLLLGHSRERDGAAAPAQR